MTDYGTANATADINGDGSVNVLDLSILLSHYGQTYTVGGGTGSQPACTIYASPAGGGSGTSATSPASLSGAYSASVAGSVICLEAGTYSLNGPFYLAKGGSAAAGYTVYRNYGGQAVIQASTTYSPASAMFQSNSGVGYIELNGLTFDGNGVFNAYDAFHALQNSDHFRLINNRVIHTSAAGFVFSSDDYAVVTGNTIWRFGDGAGWSSGISYNNSSGAYLADTAPGFHNVFADNYIAGGADGSSYDTDGNGIILDLAGAAAPTLIANNVIYMHQGRCIEAFNTSLTAYVLNNTCYKNNLDTTKTGRGEIVANGATNETWANNIADAWDNSYTYQLMGTSGVSFSHDLQYGGLGSQGVSASILSGNPLFVNPPAVASGTASQWLNAPDPATIGSAFKLQSGSPALNSGLDPRSLAGLDSTMLSQINQYVMYDITGTPRPQGSGFDLGAYEQ